VSHSNKVFIRERGSVYVFQAEKKHLKHSFVKKIELKDKEGKLLTDIRTMDYDYKEKNLVVLTSKSVFFYDHDGNYQGELIKPSPDFKPYDIDFDNYKDGIHISSLEEPAGGLFYWKNKNANPVSVLKGKPGYFEIRTIAAAYNYYHKSVYILGESGSIYEYREYDDVWKEIRIINSDNHLGDCSLNCVNRFNQKRLDL
jgi:hypothetical protein